MLNSNKDQFLLKCRNYLRGHWRSEICLSMPTEGWRPARLFFMLRNEKSWDSVRHTKVPFLLPINNKNLKCKYRRVLSKNKKRQKKGKCTLKKENGHINWKMRHLQSVLLPPNQSFYRNSCAHAKKSLKHT